MLVIGKKEEEGNTVSVRIHGQGDKGMPFTEVLSDLNLAINDRILIAVK